MSEIFCCNLYPSFRGIKNCVIVKKYFLDGDTSPEISSNSSFECSLQFNTNARIAAFTV